MGIDPAIADDGVGLTLRFSIEVLLCMLPMGDPESPDELGTETACA